jgi:uncharacterized repeat protein (TIGR01451 family)
MIIIQRRQVGATSGVRCYWGVRAAVAAAVLIFSLIYVSKSFAAGTTSGTVIQNSGTIQASNATLATSNAYATTVAAIYGIAAGTEPVDAAATAGGVVYYKMNFTNKGNNTDTIRINAGAQSFGAGAGAAVNWSLEADDAYPYVAGMTWNNSGMTKAAQAGDYTTLVLGPGAAATVTIKITTAAAAANGATMSVPISLQSVSAPAGGYTGFNGIVYGGPAIATRTIGALSPGLLTTNISGAVLALAKSASVAAPASYVSLGGSATAPAPGSKITFTITYNNTGASNALDFVVIDALPSNTTYKSGTISTSAFGAQTDAADGDKCNFGVSNANSVTCNLGTLSAGGGGTVQYAITIN